MEHALRKVSAGFAVVSALAIVAMMIAIAADVFVRNFSGASLPGMIEIAETSLVVTVFFGLAWAAVQGDHVAVTLLTDRFNPRWTMINGVLVWSITTAFLAWITYASARRALASTEMLEERFGIIRWPIYPMRWVIVAGFALLLLVAIANVIRTIRRQPPMGRASELEAAVTEQVEILNKDHAVEHPGADAPRTHDADGDAKGDKS